MTHGGQPGAVVQRIDVEPIHAVVMRAPVTLEHHLVPVGAPWEVHLDGPESAAWRTAVHLPFESTALPRQRGWSVSESAAGG